MTAKKLPNQARISIFQNSVFQLSALLEDYLYDLTSAWFAKLQAGGAQNSLVPRLTRAVTLARDQEEWFRRFFWDKNESELVEKILSTTSIFSLIPDADLMPPLDFEKLLIKDKKFPSVRNVRSLFRRVGLPKMTHLISKRTRADFELNLQAFMDIRNALAHESPPSITAVDVSHYFRQMKRWVNAIDREFHAHVEKVSGPAFW